VILLREVLLLLSKHPAARVPDPAKMPDYLEMMKAHAGNLTGFNVNSCA
jgi:hypothetical protein